MRAFGRRGRAEWAARRRGQVVGSHGYCKSRNLRERVEPGGGRLGLTGNRRRQGGGRWRTELIMVGGVPEDSIHTSPCASGPIARCE